MQQVFGLLGNVDVDSFPVTKIANGTGWCVSLQYLLAIILVILAETHDQACAHFYNPNPTFLLLGMLIALSSI